MNYTYLEEYYDSKYNTSSDINIIFLYKPYNKEFYEVLKIVFYILPIVVYILIFILCCFILIIIKLKNMLKIRNRIETLSNRDIERNNNIVNNDYDYYDNQNENEYLHNISTTYETSESKKFNMDTKGILIPFIIPTIEIDGNEDNSFNNNCPICLEKLSENVFILNSCNHMFHHTCIKTWYKHSKNCPICRKDI